MWELLPSGYGERRHAVNQKQQRTVAARKVNFFDRKADEVLALTQVCCLDPDAKRTSPYKFYQFWLNAADEDVKNYIRIFTLLNKEEIENLEAEHNTAPHLRALQKVVAKEITLRVHSEKEYEKAVEASKILFGKATSEAFKHIDEQTLLDVFEGVPQSTISKSELEQGINVVELLADKAGVFPSRGQARELIKAGGVSINKEKVMDAESMISSGHLINNKYIIAQKGKKNYHLMVVE